MNVDPRPPSRPRPPRASATAGDTLFAVGVSVLGLVLAGTLLAAGGGAPWLARALGGSGATPGGSAAAPAGRTAEPIAAVSPVPSPLASEPATPEPTPSPSPEPSPEPPATASPEPSPEPTASPPAAAGPFTMNLYRAGVFVHQVDKETCVAAAVQNTLNVIRVVEERRRPDRSERTQRALYERIVALTTRDDSHNGGTGPAGWAALLTEEGYPYEVRVYDTRNEAINAAAAALRATRRPVGILAWRGVHSWVMTGFTSSVDPAAGTRFAVTTAFVLDPWYPWVSTRWPRSEAPNAPRSTADLRANVLSWKLGSGPYPGRDGKYLLVVPLEH